MKMAQEVWHHMKVQRVQPSELFYVGMIKGWSASGQLWERVRDGSVDELFHELSNNAFEFVPTSATDGSREEGMRAFDMACD